MKISQSYSTTTISKAIASLRYIQFFVIFIVAIGAAFAPRSAMSVSSPSFAGFSTIIDLGGGATSIDDWSFSIIALPPLTTTMFLDISVVPHESTFDPEFNLFFDDGSLGLSDFIFNFDFAGPGGAESVINNVVTPGDYLLRISNFDFGNATGTDAEAIGSTNLAGAGFSVGKYDLHLDSYCKDLFSSQIQSCSVLDNLQFSTSTVPVPAAIWLFGTGILGLIGFSKRRKIA